MRVAPGAAPAPQPQRAQASPPQAQGPAQFIQMIEQGFIGLGKVIQQAGQQLPPDDIKLFQQAAQVTDAMIQSLTSPSQDQKGPQAPPQSQPGGPMPANASPNSQGQPQG